MRSPILKPALTFAALLSVCWTALAQPAAKTTSTVPRLVTIAGTLIRDTGRALSGSVQVTFAVYAEQTGGTPLWEEVQTVQTDSSGGYTVTLGSTGNEGMPAGLFASGKARWLGTTPVGETEQPRTPLVSVPYALKAEDTETVGGLPASAFALAVQPASTEAIAISSGKTTPAFTPASTPNGTAGFVPLWTDGSGDLGNSSIFQSGAGSTAKIGINTTTPVTALDVKGAATIRGTASATNYYIGSNAFAFGNVSTGNAFLGFAGNSTTTGKDNTGAGYAALRQITTSNDNTATGASAMFSNTTGYYNTASGSSALYQNTAGNNNTAAGYQSLSANSSGSENTATGYQALLANTGSNNTADGYQALAGNTLASFNTAAGEGAAYSITTGSYNAAFGASALYYDVTSNYTTGLGAGSASYSDAGFYNTFIGAGTEGATSLVNDTVIGAEAFVGESNALILGGTYNAASVGIGTSTPYYDYALDVEASPGGAINGGVVSNATGGNIFLGMNGYVHQFRVDTNGVTYSVGGFQSNGADFAESLAVRGQRSLYVPGDVLEIDQSANQHLTLSHHAYATLVAGIYSTKPGLLATPHNIDDPSVQSSEVPLAVVGVVPCKVTAENGAIARGDLLVTSSRPGYAMKGTNRQRMLGAVIGKALEPLPKGIGMIQVLITLQ